MSMPQQDGTSTELSRYEKVLEAAAKKHKELANKPDLKSIRAVQIHSDAAKITERGYR